MQANFRLILLAFLVGPALGGAGPAAAYSAKAIVQVEARASTRTDPAAPPAVPQTGFDRQRDVRAQGDASATAATGAHQPVGLSSSVGTAWGRSSAGGGGLHAFAASGFGLDLATASADASLSARGAVHAIAEVFDTVTFLSPELAIGAPLTLNFSTVLTGFMQGSGQFVPGVSQAFTDNGVTWLVEIGSWVRQGYEQLWKIDDNVFVDTRTGVTSRSFSVQVANGVATSLGMYLSVGAEASGRLGCMPCSGGAGASGTAVSDFGSTFAWGGVQSIADAAGNALPLATLHSVSTSGFDYRSAYVSPVPEAPTLLLWASAAALAGWRRLRAPGRGRPVLG